MAAAPTSGRTRVVAADDAYVVREGLAATLARAPELDVVAVCSDGNELRSAVDALQPDVVLTDARMPPSGDGEGVSIATELRDSAPTVGVVLLTQYIEAAYAVALMARGTSRRGYLLKDRIRDRTELVRAIRAVAAGESVVDPAVVEVLIETRAQSANSPLRALTPREREILAQIAEGKSNAAIARYYVLTKRAVEKHVNSIFAKLDLPGPENVSRRVAATLLFLAEHGDGAARRALPSARAS
jgi:DNA-binding NarL/FixJ family response regulator